MSSVLDYLVEGTKNTYKETTDYWGKDGSMSDAVDVVSWSVQNPDIVKEATEKGFSKSYAEFSTAVEYDRNKLIILIVLGLTLYWYIKKGGKK